MPGPYIHISSMRHVAGRTERGYRPPRSDRIDARWAGLPPQEISRLLTASPNYAALGAIGPDLFFFLPDFRDEGKVQLSSVLVKVLDFLESVYAELDPWITKYEEYVGPISNDMAEDFSRLTGGITEIAGNVVGELSGIFIGFIEKLFTEQKDWWEYFSLGLNHGWDEQSFMWSDMLHYRNTGDFGRALWRAAEAVGGDGAKAYALGYLTHIATDVTGHGFVNSISGGPFRLHWQRHHLVENHMDAAWYLQDPMSPAAGADYGQFTESALYYDIAFNKGNNAPFPRPAYPSGRSLRENYTRRNLLDIDSKLPDEIAKILIQAMSDVFYDGRRQHPAILRQNGGKPSETLVHEAYDLLFRFLKLTTTDGFSHEIPSPPKVFPNLDFPVFTRPHDEPPGGSDSDKSFWESLLDFFLSILKVLAYIGEVVLWFATLPIAIINDLLTYGARYLVYLTIELPLFHLVENFRDALVMTGYLSPMSDQIAGTLTHVNWPDSVTVDNTLHLMDDPFGGLRPPANPGPSDVTWRDTGFPHQHPEHEFKAPWLYPTTDPELPGGDRPMMTAGPHGTGAGVEALFNAGPTDPGTRDRFETATTPAEADAHGMSVSPSEHLGDVVSFSQYVLWLETRDPGQGAEGGDVPVTNWNLDSDRGYGYHCWDWDRLPSNPATDGVDLEGLAFAAPKTWPSQSGRYDPNTPLELHWTDDDPGEHG